jgi:hypothetical protein
MSRFPLNSLRTPHKVEDAIELKTMVLNLVQIVQLTETNAYAARSDMSRVRYIQCGFFKVRIC